MLILHVFVALSGLIIASFLAYAPSSAKLYATALASLGTLVSGVALILVGGSVLHACASGLLYFASVVSLMLVAGRRLAHQ